MACQLKGEEKRRKTIELGDQKIKEERLEDESTKTIEQHSDDQGIKQEDVQVESKGAKSLSPSIDSEISLKTIERCCDDRMITESVHDDSLTTKGSSPSSKITDEPCQVESQKARK